MKNKKEPKPFKLSGKQKIKADLRAQARALELMERALADLAERVSSVEDHLMPLTPEEADIAAAVAAEADLSIHTVDGGELHSV
jgi:hypothetical protein